MRDARGRDRLAGNAAWMTSGLLLKTAVQAVYFLVLARTLGPSGYGLFAGVIALLQVAAPFAGWGSGNLMVREVARNRQAFAASWARAVLTVGTLGSFLALSFTLVGLALIPEVSWILVLPLAFAELVFGRLGETAAQAFQSVERMKSAAVLQVALSLLKLSGAAALALTVGVDPKAWAWVYLSSNAIAALIGMRAVSRCIGSGSWTMPRPRWLSREGLHFSIGLASQSSYNDIDKTMLTRLSTLPEAGRYAAAYRLIDVSLTPLKGLLHSAYPRFFAGGANGLAGALAVCSRIAPFAVASAALISLGMFLTAPLIPAVLGSAYAQTVEVVRFLAVLPILRTLSYLPADVLTGSDHQRIRSRAQIFVAILNVIMNLLWIPALGWRGAAWASVVSDVALVGLLWLAVGRIARRESQPPSDAEKKVADVIA